MITNNIPVVNFNFLPGDIIVCRLTGWGFLRPLVRWAIGDWHHVMIFYSETKRGLPLIIESRGRGVQIVTLLQHQGTRAQVYRPLNASIGPLAAKAAERLADNPHSWYGYFDIPLYVLPRILSAKLGAYLPAKLRKRLDTWFPPYKHNPYYICSELVAAAYENAGYPLFPPQGSSIPLPADFTLSDKLFLVWEGVL